MKKFIKLLSLALVFTILVACTNPNQSSAEVDGSSSDAGSSSSGLVQDTEADSEAIIADLREELDENESLIADLRGELNRVSEENWNLYIVLYRDALINLQSPISGDIPHVYAFYDINHDGFAELLTGRYDENDELYLNFLYYLENFELPSQIAGKYKFIIVDVSFDIFTDGTILTVQDFEGQDLTTAELLEINDTNTAFDVIDEITIDRDAEDRSITLAEGKEKIDLEQILWHDYNKLMGDPSESTETSDDES